MPENYPQHIYPISSELACSMKSADSYYYPYLIAHHVIDTIHSSTKKFDTDNPINNKIDLLEDKVKLIVSEICGRKKLKSEIFSKIYSELLMVGNWRLQKSYDDRYLQDTVWLEINKIELRLREQVRAEFKDASRDLQFLNKEFRESVLELKLQNSKSTIFNTATDSFSYLDNKINTPGDTYRATNK